jgi:hypothetical protein
MIADVRGRNRRTVLAGVFILICALGAGRWLTQDAGVPIENWRGVGRNITVSRQSNELVVVYPGYAAAALLLYLPRDVAPLLVRMPDAAEAPEVDDALRLHRGDGPGTPARMTVVVRVDLTVRREMETFRRIASRLAEMRQEGATIVAHLIMAPDLGIAPELATTAEEVRRLLEPFLEAPIDGSHVTR